MGKKSCYPIGGSALCNKVSLQLTFLNQDCEKSIIGEIPMANITLCITLLIANFIADILLIVSCVHFMAN